MQVPMCYKLHNGERVNDIPHMMSYPESYWRGWYWFSLMPFHASMTITDYERGRSAARFVITDAKTGSTYPMFLTDMMGLIKAETLIEGRTGRCLWEPCKRGANYGIRWRVDTDA